MPQPQHGAPGLSIPIRSGHRTKHRQSCHSLTLEYPGLTDSVVTGQNVGGTLCPAPVVRLSNALDINEAE